MDYANATPTTIHRPLGTPYILPNTPRRFTHQSNAIKEDGQLHRTPSRRDRVSEHLPLQSSCRTCYSRSCVVVSPPVWPSTCRETLEAETNSSFRVLSLTLRCPTPPQPPTTCIDLGGCRRGIGALHCSPGLTARTSMQGIFELCACLTIDQLFTGPYRSAWATIIDLHVASTKI